LLFFIIDKLLIIEKIIAMKKLDLHAILEEKSPDLFGKMHPYFLNLFIKIIEKIIQVHKINHFLETHHQSDFEFIDELFEYVDFSYFVSNKDRKRIPAQGKLVCVSNHPLGALDGLALLNAIGEVRRDVKIVANDVLMNLENLNDLFLAYNVFSHSAQKENIKNIERALERDEAVIFFPAAEVSRFSHRGIRDGKWHNGALRFAQKFDCPILPIHIKGRNSIFFYLSSMINKGFSALMLPRQIFSKNQRKITIRIGDPIPRDAFSKKFINFREMNKLLKKHVYQIGKGKKGVFETEKNIIHPTDARIIRRELEQCEMLGDISGGKRIYLVEYKNAKNVIKEIARLRELTFRSVGEGTGDSKDFDRFDKHYKHIVLWNDNDLEIMGAYRLGLVPEIMNNIGYKGLYNSGQFFFSRNFEPHLYKSIELGRSFIQKKYWRSKALDYLWQGIAAYVQMNPEIEYLFGAVSISGSYTKQAQEMIVFYYEKWYKESKSFALAKNPFIISNNRREELELAFSGMDHIEDLIILKQMLKNIGFSIPILLRKYSELCEYGGARFLGFGVDESFSSSIDCMIMLDLKTIKNAQKERYYSQRSFIDKQEVLQN
jgi:putative hemolysin